jgi:hypothetical protein
MILSTALDFLSKPVVDVFSDEFSVADFWMPDWLVAQQQTALRPDLSDLFLTEQMESYDTDTAIRIEFSDLEENEGIGIIDSWHNFPYVFPISDEEIDPEENYAYVLRDNGGSTYVHISALRIIERVIGYENTDNKSYMPSVLPTITFGWEIAGQCNNQDLHELQHAAGIACEVAS